MLRRDAGWLQRVWDRAGPFDVVQVRNDIPAAHLVEKLAARHDVPFVFRHSHLKAETERLGYRTGIEGYGIDGYLKGGVAMHLRDRILRRADAVFTISPAMSEYHRSRGIETPLYDLTMGADTRITPSSIDPRPFCEEYGLTPGSYLVYIGSMNPLRGLEFCFDVISMVRETHPEVRLAMVGGRDEERRTALRRAAERRGVGDAVLFTGWVPEATLHQSIRGAGIGLSPLPPNEVFRMNSPTKVLEYLNLEIPAVVTRTPEQVEMVETSEAGVAVPYRVEPFAAAINELLADDARRHKMGAAGRSYVTSYRSYDALCKMALGYYEKLLYRFR
jgi:glycosyltransferase involved in cell wall biosynthesis